MFSDQAFSNIASRKRAKKTEEESQEAPTQDFFHPSENKTAERNSQEYDDEEDGDNSYQQPKLDKGEVKVHGEEEYCEKRCCCCVCWSVLFVILCCFAIMFGNAYMLKGDEGI